MSDYSFGGLTEIHAEHKKDHKYKTLGDDVLVLPKGPAHFLLACCDCGMVHKVYYATDNEKDTLNLYFERSDRASAQVRRHGKCGLQQDGCKGKWKMTRKEAG